MDSNGSATLNLGCLTTTSSSQDRVYDVPIAHHLGMKPDRYIIIIIIWESSIY